MYVLWIVFVKSESAEIRNVLFQTDISGKLIISTLMKVFVFANSFKKMVLTKRTKVLN